MEKLATVLLYMATALCAALFVWWLYVASVLGVTHMVQSWSDYQTSSKCARGYTEKGFDRIDVIITGGTCHLRGK